MTAVFILSINMFVSALFAVAFAVVASTNPTVRGARWLAAAYGIGVIDVALEFLLPSLAHPGVGVVAIYLVYLTALTFGVVGVATHYDVKRPKIALATIWVAALGLIPALFYLPYGSTLRTLLYQLPYVSLHVLIVVVVLRSGRRMALDRLLAAVSAMGALTYLSKSAIVARVNNAPDPQSYLGSEYAAISQTLGAVVLVALALVLLLVIMRDTTMEMVVRSETDPLSGVLNRRGFEARGQAYVEHAKKNGQPLALITIDLDRFKAINDSFGHAAGDMVIADLAALLSASSGQSDLVARLGGEEFAMLLPGHNAAQAQALAEDIRVLISRKLPIRLGNEKAVTASFGVAELQMTDQLSDLCRRSDVALYEAKAGGRNKVAAASILRAVGSEEDRRDYGRVQDSRTKYCA